MVTKHHNKFNIAVTQGIFFKLFLILFIQFFTFSVIHCQTTIYVAQSGNDNWSGLHEINKNSDGPLATLPAAVDRVRELSKKSGSEKNFRIVLKEGVYQVSKKIEISERDSFRLSIEAFPGEKPIISSGKKITGWKKSKVNGKTCWKVNLPEVKSGEYYYRQLFVNGQRANRPRLPEKGFYEVEDPLFGTSGSSGQQYADAARDRFIFREGDIKKWKNLNDINLMVLHFWQEDYLPIKEVNWEKREVLFSAKSYMAFTRSHPYHMCGNAWYYVDNVFEALDSPGEWYLDKTTGDLFYIPRSGELINETDIYAPVLTSLLQVKGNEKEKIFAGNVHISGLSFRHSEYIWNSHYGTGNNFGGSGPALISFNSVTNCSVSECEFTNLGEYAIEIQGESNQVYITGNNFSDLGAGAVKMRNCSQIHITDNEINSGGRVFHGAAAIVANMTKNCRFNHNHISDFYYNGITCSSNRNTPGSYDNLIMKNHIHDIGQGWLSDMGGIYLPGLQPGMVIRGNVIHDVNSACYGGNAVYLDDYAQHIIVEQNLLYNTNNVIVNFKGNENVVRNNILAFGGQSALRRASPHATDTMIILAYKNVILVNNTFVHRTRDEASIFKPGYWSDLNLIWNYGGEDLKVEWPFGFGKPSVTGTWEEWVQKTGNDQHSLVQDPLFKDPLNGDFTISPNSVIYKLNINPGTFNDVGPRSKDQWEFTRVKAAARETPAGGHVE